MSFDLETLYQLLPAFHRIRDAERGEPLKALLAVIAEQVEVVQENLDQLHDDQFIETCAEWVVPYLGDLLGVRGLHAVSPGTLSRRAEVGDTMALRRRKGTAAVVEQLAGDVTGWRVHVVEFFQRVVTTQNVNHRRPNPTATVDVRRPAVLGRLGTAFEETARIPEVRRPTLGGRVNLPNLGIFAWRLDAAPLTRCPASRVDDRRYRVHPLGYDAQLFTRPRALNEQEVRSGPLNVPAPITRFRFRDQTGDYYGPDRSLLIHLDGAPVSAAQIVACNLADAGGGLWAHRSPTQVAVDPELGRLALPLNSPAPQRVEVTWHDGACARMGGGEYDRLATFSGSPLLLRVPGDFSTIQAALDALNTRLKTNPPARSNPDDVDGVVEIGVKQSSGVFSETLAIRAVPGKRIEIRAANQSRPLLRTGAGAELLDGDQESQVILNGLVLAGPFRVKGTLNRLTVRHATLVPDPAFTGGDPALIVPASVARLEIDRAIVGGIRAEIAVAVQVANSIVDAGEPSAVALAAADDSGPSGALQVENSTVVGRIHTTLLALASNSLFLAEKATWPASVWSDRVQQGCVRFSYIPPEAQVPRRYRCQPETATDDSRVAPQFTSVRYGKPGYFQLDRSCPPAIRQGADDEAEMGAFHDLFQPQREINLRLRLAEYLRFGLEAGIYCET